MKNIFKTRINFYLDLGALIIKRIHINWSLYLAKARKNIVYVLRKTTDTE